MAKISEYPKAKSFDNGDVLLKNGINGTMIIDFEDAANQFTDSSGASSEIAALQATVQEQGQSISDLTSDLTSTKATVTQQGQSISSREKRLNNLVLNWIA